MPDAYTIAVFSANGAKQTALLNGEGKLLEAKLDTEESSSLVGTILVGRVERVLPDIKAAFVQIGQKAKGFLPITESDSFSHSAYAKPLLTGESVLVQVKKDPKGEKGAFLTRDITLPGQYLMLLPCTHFLGVSSRITDEKERSRAKKLGQRIADGRFGLIVRHAALTSRIQDISEEAESLYEEWLSLEKQAQFLKPPVVLRSEASFAEMLLRDYSARHEVQLVDDPERASQLWKEQKLTRQLQQALGRKVPLSNGGNLLIDEREALHTIDVNSGSFVKSEDGQSLALAENLAAVPEIARQIRLRNLGGMILIDFIDMDTDAQRRQVFEAMQAAVADDRTKTVLHDFTSLGLLELTRKRTGPTLREQYTVPCTACNETGSKWNHAFL